MNEDFYGLNSQFTSAGGVCACFHTLPKIILAAPGTGPEGQMGSSGGDGIQKGWGSNGIWEGRGSEGIQKEQWDLGGMGQPGHSGLFQAGHFGGAIRGDTRSSPDVPPCPAGLIQRNCTEWGWSLPSPPYHSACQLETLSSNNDTEAKARGSPRAVGTCPRVPHWAKNHGAAPRVIPSLGRGCPCTPSPCPLTLWVLSLPERLLCHHEGALHLRLLHVHGSPPPGHWHFLLLQVGLGAAPAPWAGGTWDKCQQGWLPSACALLEQPGPP